MTTHFSSGVTNVSGNNDLAILRTMAPNVYYGYSDDFNNYTAANWVVTNVGTTPTQAIVDGAGGILKLTATTGASDGSQLQWAGGSGSARLTTYWNSAKDLIINAKFQIDDATNCGVLIGAGSVDTTLVATPPTDGIYFYKATGGTSLIASIRKSGTSSSITLGNMVAATDVVATLAYSAQSQTWSGYLNGSKQGSISVSTNAPTNGLSVSIAQLNGTGAAHSLSIDYLNVMVQR